MKCPSCGEEIINVGVIEKWRRVVKLKGNLIVGSWGEPYAIEDSIVKIECPKCLEDIKDYIEI